MSCPFPKIMAIQIATPFRKVLLGQAVLKEAAGLELLAFCILEQIAVARALPIDTPVPPSGAAPDVFPSQDCQRQLRMWRQRLVRHCVGRYNVLDKLAQMTQVCHG